MITRIKYNNSSTSMNWYKKNFKVEAFAERRFRRWKSNLKIHKHCHCDEKTLRAIWNAMDEEDK